MMLKKLKDLKHMSKRMLLANAILAVGLLAAAVLTAVGLVQVMDVPAMKTLLDLKKIIMADIVGYLLKHYLGYAAVLAVASFAVYYVLKVEDRKHAHA